MQVVIDFFLLDFSLDRLDHFIPVRSEDIYQRDFVSLFVGSDRIMQGHILAGFLQGSQVHENFISKVSSGTYLFLVSGRFISAHITKLIIVISGAERNLFLRRFFPLFSRSFFSIISSRCSSRFIYRQSLVVCEHMFRILSKTNKLGRM